MANITYMWGGQLYLCYNMTSLFECLPHYRTKTFSTASLDNLSAWWIVYLYLIKFRKSEAWDNAGTTAEQGVAHTSRAVMPSLGLSGKKFTEISKVKSCRRILSRALNNEHAKIGGKWNYLLILPYFLNGFIPSWNHEKSQSGPMFLKRKHLLNNVFRLKSPSLCF